MSYYVNEFHIIGYIVRKNMKLEIRRDLGGNEYLMFIVKIPNPDIKGLMVSLPQKPYYVWAIAYNEVAREMMNFFISKHTYLFTFHGNIISLDGTACLNVTTITPICKSEDVIVEEEKEEAKNI